METHARDPRTIITPDAFSVDPPLLGTPLARPWRRGVALFVDIVIVGVITAITSGFWFIFGVAVSAFLFSGARKPGKGDRLSKVFRLFLGCMGLFTLSLTVVIFFGLRFLNEQHDELGDVIGGLTEAAQLRTTDSPDEATRLATALGRRLQGSMGLEDVEDALDEAIPDRVGDTDGNDILERVMDRLRLAAVEPGAPDEASEPTVDEADMTMTEALDLASDTIEVLQNDLAETRSDLARAQTELEQAQENRGLFAWLAERVESLGFGLGWWTMYFAILMPWMKGQTPGKRALGIRVVRLDGQPVSWWHAFERAGGYAAGLATGTLGFAQIYWDPNRQGIHDKIAGTVVIMDGARPVPGHWKGEPENAQDE